MKKFLLLASVATALLGANAAHAEIKLVDVSTDFSKHSGGMAIKSKYVLGDLFVPTDKPVVQIYGSFPAGESCEVSAWASRGFTTSAGAEVDLGLGCRFELGEKAELEIKMQRYLLHGSPDMTDVTATVTSGPVDVSLTHYSWKNNQDAVRVEAGYTLPLDDKFSARVLGLYESGFDLPDIAIAGAEVSYQLTKKLSLDLSGYTPVKQGRGDFRGTEVVVGLSYSF